MLLVLLPLLMMMAGSLHNARCTQTDEEVAKLESNLALQERNLRERDRSLQYLTEMLSSSSSSTHLPPLAHACGVCGVCGDVF